MKSTYLIIGFISIIVIGAAIFGFSVAGSPFETRARKFDDERVKDIRSLQTSIQSYYTKNGSLPKTLSDIDSTSYYGSKNIKEDPETGEEYEYSTTSQTKYKICATFTTVSDDKKDPYRYYDEKFEHPKGRHCFDLEIPSYSIKNQSTSRTSTQKTTTFQDDKIKSVTSNASNIQSFSTVNFPYGFFSSNTNEWGLINYEEEPVTITILFNSSVRLSAISNTFTHCSEASCYSWKATGKTKNETSVILAEDKTTSSASISTENSSKEFSEVKITATRLKGPNKYVHWKKTSFTYK